MLFRSDKLAAERVAAEAEASNAAQAAGQSRASAEGKIAQEETAYSAARSAHETNQTASARLSEVQHMLRQEQAAAQQATEAEAAAAAWTVAAAAAAPSPLTGGFGCKKLNLRGEGFDGRCCPAPVPAAAAPSRRSRCSDIWARLTR